MTDTAVAHTIEPGSVPLRNRKHEIYARERSLCSSMEMAAQAAGYAPRCGKSSQLEKRKDVRARIAYLARDDADLIREKRRRIEERLNLAAYANLMDCIEIDQETGKLKFIDWRLVKDGPLAQVISEFTFDAKTGELTRFKREDSLAAIGQLRDMFGFKAPDRVDTRAVVAAMDLTPDGDVSDAARAKAIAALFSKVRAKSEAAIDAAPTATVSPAARSSGTNPDVDQVNGGKPGLPEAKVNFNDYDYDL